MSWTTPGASASVLCRPDALLGVACGWLVADELHITAVAVDPDRRRSGHGGLLLQALLQRARQHGAVHATLEVASDNVAALALYAKAGFRTAGTRSGYYSDGRDALIQWCRIPSAPIAHVGGLKLFGFPSLGDKKSGESCGIHCYFLCASGQSQTGK